MDFKDFDDDCVDDCFAQDLHHRYPSQNVPGAATSQGGRCRRDTNSLFACLG